jgi:PAS domain-containing protein
MLALTKSGCEMLASQFDYAGNSTDLTRDVSDGTSFATATLEKQTISLPALTRPIHATRFQHSAGRYYPHVGLKPRPIDCMAVRQLVPKTAVPSSRASSRRSNIGQSIDYASAVLSCPSGIVITDPSKTDNPIVFVNPAFTELTGYSSAESIGRNCRFLQGALSDPKVIQRSEKPSLKVIRSGPSF